MDGIGNARANSSPARLPLARVQILLGSVNGRVLLPQSSIVRFNKLLIREAHDRHGVAGEQGACEAVSASLGNSPSRCF